MEYLIIKTKTMTLANIGKIITLVTIIMNSFILKAEPLTVTHGVYTSKSLNISIEETRIPHIVEIRVSGIHNKKNAVRLRVGDFQMAGIRGQLNTQKQIFLALI